MNVLILGSNGQLGSEIRDISSNYKDFKFVFRDLPELDICNFDQLDAFIINHKIKFVINCAAYTAVDKAEIHSKIAENVNSTGVLNLVNILAKTNGKLIHISTDYVFDGNHFKPYTELDNVNPLSVYGRTKRFGELAILNNNLDAIIIRTSWLYSTYGNNFLNTIFRLGKEKESLEIIYDQIGNPTYAKDLANTCLEILSKCKSKKMSKRGKLYHYSNEGIASWYDFAIAIIELANLNCFVEPIQTIQYPTLAKRPQYSVLNKSKIKNDFEILIPYWRDSLAKCILKLKKT